MSKSATARRSRLGMAALVVAVLILGSTVTAMGGEGDGDDDPSPADPPNSEVEVGGETEEASSEIETVSVENRDLVEEDEFNATIGHEAATELTSQLEGTVTDLPEAGDIIRPGEVLFEVDERPIYLLKGATPMWRALDSSVDDGRDVRQLEQALVELGFGDDVTVDQEWTWYTTDALQEWEESLDLYEDGALELGEVVFAPGPIRIQEVTATLGGASAGPIGMITDIDQVVESLIDPEDTDLMPVDSKVEVELPDETTVSATVTEIGGVPDEEGRLPVTLILDKPVDLADGTTTEIHVDRMVAQGVKTVPVTGLVALLEGGHAVEVVADDGSTRLVPVEIGSVVDGWVEITGEVQPGQSVITA